MMGASQSFKSFFISILFLFFFWPKCQTRHRQQCKKLNKKKKTGEVTAGWTPFPDKLATGDQSTHSITHESKKSTTSRPLNLQQQQQQRMDRRVLKEPSSATSQLRRATTENTFQWIFLYFKKSLQLDEQPSASSTSATSKGSIHLP